MTLCSSGLELSIPKGGMILPGDTKMIPLNWRLRVPPGHFGVLMSLSQQAKKGVTVLFKVIDPDHQGETGLLLCNGGKEEYV